MKTYCIVYKRAGRNYGISFKARNQIEATKKLLSGREVERIVCMMHS